jgi:hypothetical protein
VPWATSSSSSQLRYLPDRHGDLAFRWGTERMVLVPVTEGAAIELNNRGLSMFRRQNRWLVEMCAWVDSAASASDSRCGQPASEGFHDSVLTGLIR